MFSNSIRRPLATASLALALAASPVVISAQHGLHAPQAAAREAESGGRHREAGDDRGGNRGGTRAGDDHPGSHSQNGKRK